MLPPPQKRGLEKAWQRLFAGPFGGSRKPTSNIFSTPDRGTVKAAIPALGMPLWPRPPLAAFGSQCRKGPAHLRKSQQVPTCPSSLRAVRGLHPRGRPAYTSTFPSRLDQLRAEQSAPVSSRCCSDARPARSPWKPRQREAALVLLLSRLHRAHQPSPGHVPPDPPVQTGGQEEPTSPRPSRGFGASGDEPPRPAKRRKRRRLRWRDQPRAGGSWAKPGRGFTGTVQWSSLPCAIWPTGTGSLYPWQPEEGREGGREWGGGGMSTFHQDEGEMRKG